MGYQIYKFDDALLPVGNNEQDHSPGEASASIRDSVGGSFDYDGTYQRYPRRMTVQISGLYIGELGVEVDHAGNYIVDESGNNIVTHAAPVDLRVQVEALQRKVGKRASLWRRWLDDTTVEQWKTARLLQATWPQSYQDGATMASLTCVWETRMAAWRAETVTSATTNFNSNMKALNVFNGGAMRVDDAIIQIAASGSDITSVQIYNGAAGIDLRYTGTIVDGTSVFINCGTGTVLRNGINRYSEFALGSGHTARGWLPLEPGPSPFVVTVTGQGDIYIRHYDQWP